MSESQARLLFLKNFLDMDVGQMQEAIEGIRKEYLNCPSPGHADVARLAAAAIAIKKVKFGG